MPEFRQTMTIGAPPAQVFDFVSNISNLPKYLPTTKEARSQGPDRVRVKGEANDHPYDSDGYLRCDRQAMKLEWGADEGYYNGRMDIRDDGGPNASEVTVHISLRQPPPGSQQGGGPSEEDINEGLRKSLESIRNHVEGKGGKAEPAAAT